MPVSYRLRYGSTSRVRDPTSILHPAVPNQRNVAAVLLLFALGTAARFSSVADAAYAPAPATDTTVAPTVAPRRNRRRSTRCPDTLNLPLVMGAC
jgi:hypothetical protein